MKTSSLLTLGLFALAEARGGLGGNLTPDKVIPDEASRGQGMKLGLNDLNPDQTSRGQGMKLGLNDLNPDQTSRGQGMKLGLNDLERTGTDTETKTTGMDPLKLEDLVQDSKSGPGVDEFAPPEVAGENQGQLGGLDSFRINAGNTNNPNAHNFNCVLQVDFFEGFGRKPLGPEVWTLVTKSEEWMTDLFEDDTVTSQAFNSFRVNSFEPHYDETLPDEFVMTFSATVNENAGSVIEQMTMEDIAATVTGADYEEFIRDYLWKAEGVEANEFFETHSVDLGCWTT